MAPQNHVLLSKLAWTDKNPVLKLRLLHTWIAGNPNRPASFYEHSTLWTDELGVLIQAVAPRQLSPHLNEVLTVGRVYFISLFTQREARKRWASCSNDRILDFTAKTTFVSSNENDAQFCLDSFEFREFENLEAIAGQAAHLVGEFTVHCTALRIQNCLLTQLFYADVVGRLVSATTVTYYQKNDRSIRRRTVVIQNERDMSISVTLWGDFAERLALQELIQMDGAAAVIVAFTSLNLSIWRGTVGASSTSATRIVVSPPVPHAQPLALHFAGAVGALGVVPIECDTPEKAMTLYRDSFRTIAELQNVQSISTMGGKFRCKATVTDIDMSREWCYLACAVCCKAAIRRDAPFWCDKCSKTVNPHELKHCFRIRVMGQDGSTCAPFVLLAQTAESLLGVSASALLAAAPDRGGGYPPEIECLLGKEYIFLIKLPIGQVADPLDDFCVAGVEKEDQTASMDRKPHGPRFVKTHGQVVSTVPRLLTGKFTGPFAPAAFDAVLSAASGPSTAAKPSSAAASSTLQTTIQTPISPGRSQPLAKVKLEKLEESRQKKKKNVDISDDLPLSQLKTKASRGRTAAKKLF
ncbi:unnamed protein product [Linum tenue]|uniref:Replication factor A C-terminal domain-containing protein n=1 Tax=Linum tenue TaxID=586396 RepID=A0AAV0S914_9ROSI|nr:unnamed protein product [Linum tenue]